MKIKYIDHIKLTVSDLDKSKAFWSQIPGFQLVAEHPGFVMFAAGNFRIGLADHEGKIAAEVFSEFNVGLDHFAMHVDRYESLIEARNWLEASRIEHGDIIQLSNGMFVISFRDPNNIQIEFCFKP